MYIVGDVEFRSLEDLEFLPETWSSEWLVAYAMIDLMLAYTGLFFISY